jgi:AraC-like DNA-binding protein
VAYRSLQERFDRLPKRQQTILLSFLAELELLNTQAQPQKVENPSSLDYDIEPFKYFKAFKPKERRLYISLKELWNIKELAKPDINELAEKVFVSPNYLRHLCKKHLKTTLTKIGQLFAVEKAKKSLEQSDNKITSIALDLGFASSSHFTRIFKSIVGKSPLDYKKCHAITQQ